MPTRAGSPRTNRLLPDVRWGGNPQAVAYAAPLPTTNAAPRLLARRFPLNAQILSTTLVRLA